MLKAVSADARQVVYLSRAAARDLDPPPGSAIVAVKNPGATELDLAAWSACLRMSFHDIECPYEDFRLMSWSDAFRIVSFVAQQRNCGGLFAAHCDSGVARSAAIAAYVHLATGRQLSECPEGLNVLVFRRLVGAHSMRTVLKGRVLAAVSFWTNADRAMRAMRAGSYKVK